MKAQRYIWAKDGMVPNAKGGWVKAEPIKVAPKKKAKK